jgi:Ca-activated chloride channel family protein
LAVTSAGKKLGQCPLKHTDVKASISGYVSRVSVKQVFHNSFNDKIEAVYTFPLPENAAVDEMTMKVGTRTIKGAIKKREEAREIYETAKNNGEVASLLDQERPNIFTQTVANIEPGATVEIEIKYLETLSYESGSYTFNFPTVVGPRFVPGNSIEKSGSGRLADTDVVPDASRITPQVAEERAGHDISISVDIDAGMPIRALKSQLHEVKVTQHEDKAHVELLDKNTIPNKDFVLRWDVAAEQVQSGYLAHCDKQSGYFTLMVMPPVKVQAADVAPKEMIFLIDCSGSQSGPPLQKAKETMDYILDHMNSNDTFQFVAFNDRVQQFSERPQVASAEIKKRAHKFVANLQANGGTWMAPAVEHVCAMKNDDNRLRIVSFMTDGYVGNDMEIISLVKKYRNKSRWFPFGTGNGVNRFLIDQIAKEGGGEPDYVLLNSPGAEVGKKFYDRISTPLLTDLKLDFGGLAVREVFPHELSDLWAQKPLYITGRYLKPGAGTITLTGFAAGKPYSQELKVKFPEVEAANEVIKPIWARAKVDRLMSEDWMGAQNGSINKEIKEDIVKTALDYHIMTQYTSFVAVEEKHVTAGGAARTVAVPVEIPEGVSRAASGAADGIGGVAGFGSFVARKTRAGGAGAGSAVFLNASLPPPPLPTSGSSAPSSIPQPSPRSGSWYAAPRQPEILSEQPIVRDSRDKTISNTNETDALSQKFDKLLTELLEHERGGLKTKIPGLEVHDGKILVKITLSSLNEATLKILRAVGAEALVNSPKDHTVVARILISKLEELSEKSEVLKIEAATLAK